MSTFKYELESLLNVREKMEDIKQKEYAEALEILEKKKTISNQIDNSLKNNTLKLKDSISDIIDAREIKIQQNYQLLLKKQKGVALHNVEIAHNKTKEQRKELLNAMRNKKTLEILKDKKYEQFKDEQKKEEQLQIDEIVSFAYKQD